MASLPDVAGTARHPASRRHTEVDPGRCALDVTDALSTALERQVNAVRLGNPAELASVTRAAGAAWALAGELDLGDFVEPVVLDAKPRVLLRFRARGSGRLAALGPDVVLKVYGDRPRGEGPVLKLWRERGLHTPCVQFGERGTCSWVALEYLRLTSVAPRGRGEILALTEQLAGCAARMHEPAPELTPVLRPLEQIMLPRWEIAFRTLRAHAYAVPNSWHAHARRAYASGSPTLLHGDLGLPNIARDPDGRLVVYDASALHGPVSFDAARWAARIGSAGARPVDVAVLWADVEEIPWGPADDELLATECVLEAGSRAGVLHGEATDPSGARPDVLRLLDEAHRLFERHP